MTVFKLDPAPTFDAAVDVPVHGSDAVKVKFTFKHRSREQLEEFMQSMVGKSNAEAVMDVASGWELTDEFNAENINKLCNNYMGAAYAIAQTYFAEIRQARLGN